MTDTTVILGKAQSIADRGPMSCNTDESSKLTVKYPNPNPINGSSVSGALHLAEDDRRKTRKAQALKANLAKRKQQQRARSNYNPQKINLCGTYLPECC